MEHNVFIGRSGRGIESKVGRTALTKRVRQELERDAELLRDPTSGVKKVTWEFSASPTTGRKGPTPKLQAAIQALQDEGLDIEIVIR